jgi:hypothetical protein
MLSELSIAYLIEFIVVLQFATHIRVANSSCVLMFSFF